MLSLFNSKQYSIGLILVSYCRYWITANGILTYFFTVHNTNYLSIVGTHGIYNINHLLYILMHFLLMFLCTIDEIHTGIDEIVLRISECTFHTTVVRR